MKRVILGLLALPLSGALGCGSGGGTSPDASPPPAGPPLRDCVTHFAYRGGGRDVSVAGEWNRFDATQTPMRGPDAGGAFHADVPLDPGAWGYKIVVDGSVLLDPANPYTKFVDGVENSLVEVGDCQAPALAFLGLDKSADGSLQADAQYVDGAGGAGLDPAQLVVLLDGAPLPDVGADPTGRITLARTGLGKGKHRLVVQAADRAGRAAEALLVPFWIEDEPFDFRDGLLYFAFTDRFRNGQRGNDGPVGGVDARANYQGGDFAGIRSALESGYFESLGVRTLWISPPNANPDHGEVGTGGYLYSGYHGYWPTAGRATQPRFGSLDELKALVQAAHARGIRVLVDVVLNHVHKESPLYLAHQHDGWFNGDGTCVCGGPGCDWDTHRLDCWFTPYLPDVDYRNFDALKTMIDDALFWAVEADVDGFRVDAVKHFYPAATRRLRALLHDRLEHAEPLFYLVGETFDGDRGLIASFLGPSELSAQFDFPLYFDLRTTLADDAGSLRWLEASSAASEAAYGGAPMSPFLGNHDVPRFLTQAAGMLSGDPQAQAWQNPPGPPPDDTAYERLRLALAFVTTQPGVPLVYYGDEIGTPGAADPDNRRPLKWGGYTPSEAATLALTRTLGAARAELRALRRGSRTTLWIDDDLYVFARVAGQEVVLVALNRSGVPRTESVPVPPTVPLADGTVLRDRLGGPPLTVSGGQVTIGLGARAGAVLAP